MKSLFRRRDHTAEPPEDPPVTTTTTNPEDTGAHLEAEKPDNRPDCPTCQGSGACPTCSGPGQCTDCDGTGKTPRVTDVLNESLTLFPADDPTQMDAFIGAFYGRVVAADARKAPGDKLAPLFPRDIVSGPAVNASGRRQREVLLHAVVGVVANYDPDDLETPNMRQLVEVLRKEGRNHAAFLRPDGTVRGATVREYLQIEDILMGLIHDTFGDRWLPKYDEAWAEAYEFAMVEMLHSAQHYRRSDGGRPYPRSPRSARQTEAAQ